MPQHDGKPTAGDEPAINGHRYSVASVEVIYDGVPIVGIVKDVHYEDAPGMGIVDLKVGESMRVPLIGGEAEVTRLTDGDFHVESVPNGANGKPVIDVVPDQTYVRTPPEDQAGKLCACARCEADGQHEPMCSVHVRNAEDRQGACDCARRD